MFRLLVAEGKNYIFPYRKQLVVSRLTPETTSADVLEFIEHEFPSQNITVEEFKFPYVCRISSFKLSAPPGVFNAPNFKSFCFNEELVIKKFVPSRRGLKMKLPKLQADSSAFSEDILALTETWLKPEISDPEVMSKNFSTYRTDRSPLRGVGYWLPLPLLYHRRAYTFLIPLT